MYKHGIEIEEKITAYTQPLATQYGVQVVVGTAPINLADNMENTVSKPIKASSLD